MRIEPNCCLLLSSASAVQDCCKTELNGECMDERVIPTTTTADTNSLVSEEWKDTCPDANSPIMNGNIGLNRVMFY